jgi:polyhydroxybutyrate depolymerase
MTRPVARRGAGSRFRSAAAAIGASVLLTLGLAVPASAAPVGPAPASRAATCAWEPGTTELTITSGGVERRALVFVPTETNPGKRLPVVLNLHGSGSTPEEQMARSGLAATAEEEGFIVVAPQGGVVSGAGWAWNVPFVTSAPGAPDDVAFLEDLVAALEASGCVDPKRIYASGYSGGGRMISQVACENPDLFAAIAPVAGLRAGAPLAGDPTEPDTTTCAPDTNIPVLTFHGTADIVNWYAGGGLFPYWGYSVATALERWAEINECRQEATTEQVTESVTVTSYRACRANADVVLYTIEGGGHTWPGSDPSLYPPVLLPVTQEIDANEIMWEFFRTRVSTSRT